MSLKNEFFHENDLKNEKMTSKMTYSFFYKIYNF